MQSKIYIPILSTLLLGVCELHASSDIYRCDGEYKSAAEFEKLSDAGKNNCKKLESGVPSNNTTRSAEVDSKSEGRIKQSTAGYYVKEFGIEKVNSAGGVEPYFLFVNPDESTRIKYINLRLTPYNAVGDTIASSIGGKRTASLRFTGPLSHSDGESRSGWEPVWYNATADCLKLESIGITFMNGKQISFEGKNVNKALAPGVTNDCRVKK